MAVNTQDVSPERNIWGRHGKLFYSPITTDSASNQAVGAPEWMANVTEVTWSVAQDNTEVLRSGKVMSGYKGLGVTGTGSLTYDKIDSKFEKAYIDYINSLQTSNPQPVPSAFIVVSLEDPSIPGISFDENGFAKSGHEAVVLKCVKFWSLDGGYSTSDVVTRSRDFTFESIQAATAGGKPAFITEPTTMPVRYC